MTATTKRIESEAFGLAGQLRSLLGVMVSQEFILAVLIIVLSVLTYQKNANYGTSRNLLNNVLLNSSYIAVAAIGMTLVIITGNIDISIGALIGVLATVSGQMVTHSFPVWLSWLLPVLLGALMGAVIGFFVAYLKIPAIVVTLGMASILKGGLIMATGGAWIYDLPESYKLAQQEAYGIKIPIYFMVILTVIVLLWMRYSPLGRAIYAVGGNAEAARLSGISRERTLMAVFMINGLMVGISAILFATQFATIQSTVPPGLDMKVITAAVIGGVSILGGSGTVLGAMLGAILLLVINSSMIFWNVSQYWLQAVQGSLILATVLVDIVRRRQLSVRRK